MSRQTVWREIQAFEFDEYWPKRTTANDHKVTESTSLQRDVPSAEFTGEDDDHVQYDERSIRDGSLEIGQNKTEATGDIRQAQKQLGHGSVTMTEHYVRKRRGDKVGPTR